MMRLPTELALQPAGVGPGDGGGGEVSPAARGGGDGDGDATTVDDGGGDGDGESLTTAGGDGDGEDGVADGGGDGDGGASDRRRRRRVGAQAAKFLAPPRHVAPDRPSAASPSSAPVGTDMSSGVATAARAAPAGRRARRRRRAAAEVACLLAHLGDVASRRTLARRRLPLAPVFRIRVEAAGVKGGKGAGGWAAASAARLPPSQIARSTHDAYTLDPRPRSRSFSTWLARGKWWPRAA